MFCYDRDSDTVVEFTQDVADYDSRDMYDDGNMVSTRYVLLECDPDFEDNIRNAFIETVEEPAVAAKLESAANRYGAEKHFLNAVIAACLEREWFNFRGDRYEAEARHFCDVYGIPYE